MSKTEIKNNFADILFELKAILANNDIDTLINKYKKIEENLSEIELCLAEQEPLFHCDGIAYSFYQIGSILSTNNV